MRMGRVQGVNKLKGQFKREAGYMPSRLARGLMKGALFLLRKSLDIVPVDQGFLRASGKTRLTGTKDKPEAVVSYGGEASAYAVIVHEDLTKAHGEAYNIKYADEIKRGVKHSRGPNQQAKFLEQPLRENYREIGSIVRDEVKKR